MEVNFFWKGNEFGFLEKIVMQSHLKVGHEPVIWLDGKPPNNKFWNEIESFVKIKNSVDICPVDDFIKTGGNLITASSFWRFTFLYEKGGLYCDTDAFALKKFPENTDWILASFKAPKRFSTGVLKAPPKQEVMLECIKLTNKKWGNVIVFSDVYRKYYGNTNPTHPNADFYPYEWTECKKLFQKIELPTDSYSIHFYTKALKDFIKRSSERRFNFFPHIEKNLKNYDENWCEKNPKSLLGRLYYWVENSE